MLEAFFDDLSKMALFGEPKETDLDEIGRRLTQLARSTDWGALGFRRAVGSEELVHVLHETRQGPSLYLVSDAAGVRSLPHEHPTWAVIAGLSGNELNVVYGRADAGTRTVRPLYTRKVGPGDVIALAAGAIHSTHALGAEPTFHLHLYGLPLGAFPSFASRCYSEVLP